MPVLGTALPRRLGIPANTDAAFPDTPGTYTSPDGAIIVPSGALSRWFDYRATLGAVRRELVVFGDSTTLGSDGAGDGNYSWLQRLRDRAVSFGMADGGKGIFAGLEGTVAYDPPEVNGLTAYTFAGSTDTFDNLFGSYLYDTGSPADHTLTLAFRSTAIRLWYRHHTGHGDFTYTIDGGSPVTISPGAGTTVRYVYISGLSAGVTHTIVITNTGGGGCAVALAPVNATGLAIQKHAMSGGTFNVMFHGAAGTPPYTQAQNGFRYQTALGLADTTVQGSNGYVGAPVDTTYAAGERVTPVLAITHLGFNDLTSTVDSTDLPGWVEYVKKFGAACRSASCDGIVVSGQLPYNANWPTYGAARFRCASGYRHRPGTGVRRLSLPDRRGRRPGLQRRRVVTSPAEIRVCRPGRLPVGRPPGLDLMTRCNSSPDQSRVSCT